MSDRFTKLGHCIASARKKHDAHIAPKLTSATVLFLRACQDAEQRGERITVRGVCDAVGRSSTSTGWSHLRKLEKLGYLRRMTGATPQQAFYTLTHTSHTERTEGFKAALRALSAKGALPAELVEFEEVWKR
jgi:SOS-response transcriptional repressor LexA